MKDFLCIRPFSSVKQLDGIDVEFIHAGEETDFDPFTVIENFITSFYSLKVKERLMQPFPITVIPRFRKYFFSSVGKVQCVAWFYQGRVKHETHLFTGQTLFTSFLRVDYYKDGNLLFEYFKCHEDSLSYINCVEQLANISELRLPRSNDRILVQNHLGETCLLDNGDSLQIWLVKSWKALSDVLY
ncbi:hypothetical protein LZF95_03465 [Algoriphagus sp. AGSA1]|uniref:hypothetical protein n=1 Tax=Algoriphagus sp. AGSA1 TaxID=2907213 RepID=UPI001F1C9578|nr:hypothetical protein [Algoriphagus sp. AGSA1]MCE7053723.1 hypothetical protein [Algoriphagus sp. AGSA1]